MTPRALTARRRAERPRGTGRLRAGDGDGPWFAGTVGYIDPCCLREGLPATASSDLYGLGVLLYEALPGKLPAAVGGAGRPGGRRGCRRSRRRS